METVVRPFPFFVEKIKKSCVSPGKCKIPLQNPNEIVIILSACQDSKRKI